MWTYLAIFGGGLIIVLVFLHRVIVNTRASESNLGSDTSWDIEKGIIENEIQENQDKILSREDRDTVSYNYQKAERMINSGEEDEAIKFLIQALAINPLHVESLHKLAVLYMNRQMYSQSAALIKQLVSLTEDPVHYSNLGLALYQTQDYEGAKKAYQIAVLKDHNRPQRFVSLSQVYRTMGNIPLAIIALNKALELESTNVDFWLLLAHLQSELNRIQDAKIALEKVFDLDPGNTEAREIMQELRKKMGV